MVGKKEKYLVAAQKFIERGQLDKALAEFSKVVQEDAKDTRTWLKMAELHAKRGANAEATEIYLRTGDLYIEQGFAQKAVAVYKNVLKLSPGTVPAHLKLGTLFKQLGLMSDAVQQMELGANALQRADKLADAVAALRQAMEIQPDNVVLRVKLAECASGAGLTEEAVREFGKAADQLKAQGRNDESLRVVERLLFHQPQNFAKARELAEAYIAKGSPRLALPKLQACLNGDPRDPRTLSLLARALEQLGQVPKAVSVLKELARLCADLGRNSERDAAVLRGLTLDPADAELRSMAARNQLRGAVGGQSEATPRPVGVPDVAIGGGGSFDLSGVVRMAAGGTSGRVVAPIGTADSGLRVGISAGPPGAGSDVSRILAEAEVFVKYGLLERAVDHLGRVFEFDPEQQEARDRLIAVLQRLGRKEEAARHLEILAGQLARTSPDEAKKLAGKALLLNPEAAWARQLLATLPASGPGPGQRPGKNPLPGVDLDLDLGIEVDVDDGEDPAALQLTPPVARMPPSLQATPPPEVAATDFDDEIHTGDVVFDSGDDASAEDAGENDEAVTPGPLTPPRTPIAAPSGRAASARGADAVDSHADPVDGFFDSAATMAGEVGGFFDSTATIAGGVDGFFDSAATKAGGVEHAVGVLAVEIDEDELSAELEQVSFFFEQSLFEDARTLLKDLETRFPRHRRVAAKLRELHDFDARLGALFLEAAVPPVISPRAVVRSTMIQGPSEDATPAPRAVVEGGDVPDFATQADLAVAYKGMGLFDAAIGELKLLVQDPDHEVFALTTMGECFEAKGTFTEAVIRYKRALNCAQITREETLELYYLLGGAFDRLGDVSEALYFYEKVAKRDPTFRDVTDKVAELKPRLVKRAR